MSMCVETHVDLHENWSLRLSNINKLKFLTFFYLFHSVICYKNFTLNNSPFVICIEIGKAEQF